MPKTIVTAAEQGKGNNDRVVMTNTSAEGMKKFEKISGQDKDTKELLKKHRIDG